MSRNSKPTEFACTSASRQGIHILFVNVKWGFPRKLGIATMGFNSNGLVTWMIWASPQFRKPPNLKCYSGLIQKCLINGCIDYMFDMFVCFLLQAFLHRYTALKAPQSINLGKLQYFTWIKATWGWFPLLTMIPVRSQWGRYNLPRYIGCPRHYTPTSPAETDRSARHPRFPWPEVSNIKHCKTPKTNSQPQQTEH